MAFTIKEYTDFSRLLRQHPEWREDLRRLLLTDDVLALPQELRDLTAIVRALAESQRQFADAQRRTDLNITELRKEVGGLANIFGFRYEEFVAALLPPYLARHYGVSALALERRYIDMGGGRFEEVDLVGEGRRENEALTILVECRASIGGGEVRNLADKLDSVRGALLAQNSARVIVAMNIHPSAEPVAQETGIWLIPYHKIDRERG
ncbi:MAG: hypothetical protein HY327_01580 [Chloroflexi bacterium]|nr:hypothetical protein [Chloroflexota bacterium]